MPIINQGLKENRVRYGAHHRVSQGVHYFKNMSDIFKNFIQNLIPWILSHGLRIFFIFLAAFLIVRIGKKFIDKVIKKTIVHEDRGAGERREKTLIRIFSGTLKIVVWAIAVMMIIPEFGVNIGPILAGAGILGVAIGFGAQYVIRDFLAGLFIVFENQYKVGDVVCFGGTCGAVEDISLRKTILRDLDGKVHHIPNGEIKMASNLTHGFSRIHFNVGVAYKEDLDKVIKVINKVGKEMAEEEPWKDYITKAPEVLGVDDFADSAIIIKILGETKPLKQWDTMREMKKRIKIAFDKEGIEIPFPQVSVWPRGPWENKK